MRVGSGMLLALVTIASGCSASGGSPAGDNETPIAHRGLVVFGHEVRSFEPCSSETSLWTVDSSGVLWDLHSELALQDQPYQGLFAVVEGRLGEAPQDGFGADYAGTLVVDDVLYMAREGLGCDFNWSAFRYRALGNEPFWSADISATHIVLRMMGQDDQTWTLTHEGMTDGAVQFDGEGAGGSSITVGIQREQCRDTMAGNFFGYTATVRLGDSTLTGCAVEGTQR